MKNSDAVASAFLNQSIEYLVNHYQPKIESCVAQLSDEQIWWRPNSSSNSIGNLILHVCGNARQWIVSGLGDERDHRVRDLEFSQTEIIPREELVKLLDDTLTDVRTVLENLPTESLLQSRKIQGRDVLVLEAVFHVTEHFSMHTGQIILLTKR
ncbi:MAG TPA: DinB family protein [Pyrinomonadaceae bacterium]